LGFDFGLCGDGKLSHIFDIAERGRKNSKLQQNEVSKVGGRKS
jgi:hypothetical protein